MTDRCALIEFLGAAGPARVPLRVCCVFSLLEHGENAPVCALEQESVPLAEPAFSAEPEPVP
ncbi:hypothetical protein HH310_39195 [Actinoplanes sp. TBRC 11911]|uniref:hypothetical protein n=1 Tax=Actinoplanes sp. TBRC 11911 TaxID=2729386 RepID=UPI00145C6ABC|nr:hypothetical protein [Actinoplanes sp. TBRC 11911]NMO57186.1 hypothetical protein [Actinoplanes sp. TBRC 11911]